LSLTGRAKDRGFSLIKLKKMEKIKEEKGKNEKIIEKEREREREREREKERKKERKRERDRDRERKTETENER
jgi:hypothetical protein